MERTTPAAKTSTAPSLAAGTWGHSYAYAPSPRELLTPRRGTAACEPVDPDVTGIDDGCRSGGRTGGGASGGGRLGRRRAAVEEDDAAAAAAVSAAVVARVPAVHDERSCRSRRPARPSFAPMGDGAAGDPGPSGWGWSLRRQRAPTGDGVFWSDLKSVADLPTRLREAIDGSGSFLEEADTGDEIRALARERTVEKFRMTWHIERSRTAPSQGHVSSFKDLGEEHKSEPILTCFSSSINYCISYYVLHILLKQSNMLEYYFACFDIGQSQTNFICNY